MSHYFTTGICHQNNCPLRSCCRPSCRCSLSLQPLMHPGAAAVSATPAPARGPSIATLAAATLPQHCLPQPAAPPQGLATLPQPCLQRPERLLQLDCLLGSCPPSHACQNQEGLHQLPVLLMWFMLGMIRAPKKLCCSGLNMPAGQIRCCCCYFFAFKVFCSLMRSLFLYLYSRRICRQTIDSIRPYGEAWCMGLVDS